MTFPVSGDFSIVTPMLVMLDIILYINVLKRLLYSIRLAVKSPKVEKSLVGDFSIFPKRVCLIKKKPSATGRRPHGVIGVGSSRVYS